MRTYSACRRTDATACVAAMPRLFVALTPPAAMADTLLSVMSGIAGARWQRRDQLHLTLEFLDEVDDRLLPDIDAALSALSHPPVLAACRGVGHFSDRGRPTAVWAAAQPADDLATLATSVSRACRQAGVTTVARRFVPHITLARLNRSCGPIDAFLARNGGLATPPFRVDTFGLFSSHPRPDGSIYDCLASYPLSG